MNVLKAFLLTIMFGIAQSVYASPILTAFDITVTQDDSGGTYLGETGTGTLVFNQSFLPNGGDVSGLQVNDGNWFEGLAINIFGLTLSEQDDADYPDYPTFEFSGGEFVGIDFLVEDIIPSLVGYEFALSSTTFDPQSGRAHVEASIEFVGISAVPIPAAAWLFGSGFLSLIGFSRKL